MNETPPSEAKLALIREFMQVSGLQADIDSGRCADRDGRLRRKLSEELIRARPDMLFGDFLAAPGEALRAAYATHRHVWQEEYEGHLNWEFTAEELSALVGFFSSAAGRHFLEARSRMEAYIATNTEHLAEPLFSEAREKLIGDDATS